VLDGKGVLVTGATGRLGRDLCHRLESLGAEVTPVILPGYPLAPRNVPWTAGAVPVEIEDRKDLEALPVPDDVIHLHWLVDRSRPFAEQIENEIRWNVTGPIFLWDWLKDHGVPGFVNVSSIRVFGTRNRNPISAATEPLPSTPYGIAKLAGEAFFGAYFPEATVVTQARLGSVCSHGEHPTQLITQLVASAEDGARIKVNAGHEATLLYIDEAVDLLIEMIRRRPGGRHLLVAPPRPITEIAALVERITGRPLQADQVDLAPGTVDPEFVSDLETFHAGWTRRVDLEEAIRRMLADYRKASAGSR